MNEISTIKNFGFMWDREDVNWGSRGRGGGGSLDGIQVGNLKRRVDFSEQYGIYVLYDRSEAPVQVGQSKCIFKRLKQHRRDHLRNRWRYFTWFGFYGVTPKTNTLIIKTVTNNPSRLISLASGLDEMESLLIQVMEPRLNRQGARWKQTEEYLQSLAKNGELDEGDDGKENDQ